MDKELETAIPSFFRRRKKFKRVRFQLPGTKSTAKRNNLERHLKLFPADNVAQLALVAVGGGTITEPFNLF